MDAVADRLEFAPPPQPGLLRGMLFAVAAHLLLLLAFTWGLQWKRDSQDTAAEAELWSSLPQQAAPQEVAPPPPPPTVPVQREEPRPEPKQREADIAVEREKQRKQREAEARREAEEDKREQQRKKAEAERKEKEELKKQEQARLAAENRKKEDEKKRREQQQEARLKQMREENLKRMQGMAGGSPSSSTGTAAQSSGPSAGWAGRVRARVKPNIVFTDDVAGNPTAEVALRLAPDGTIVSRTITKSSGVKAWDEAVLRALDKTETLPRDTDGRVPQAGTMVFRLKDF